jgi:hypothetical protein
MCPILIVARQKPITFADNKCGDDPDRQDDNCYLPRTNPPMPSRPSWSVASILRLAGSKTLSRECGEIGNALVVFH